MKVRVSVPNVIAKIAAYVADPEHAKREHAFELSMAKRGAAYVVDSVTERVRGETSTVHTPKRPATAHTHNIQNYKDQQCHVGWPSGEDMHWIFSLAVSHAKQGVPEPVVHLCSAMEGTYIIACSLRALASMPDDDVGRAGDDILAHFASAHGHRCSRGAKRERHPCGGAFVRMAHKYRFSGPRCERHAGESESCSAAGAHRRLAASLHRGQVFSVRFVPHALFPGGAHSRGYCRNDGPRHLRGINFGRFDMRGSVRVPLDLDYVEVELGEAFV